MCVMTLPYLGDTTSQHPSPHTWGSEPQEEGMWYGCDKTPIWVFFLPSGRILNYQPWDTLKRSPTEHHSLSLPKEPDETPGIRKQQTNPTEIFYKTAGMRSLQISRPQASRRCRRKLKKNDNLIQPWDSVPAGFTVKSCGEKNRQNWVRSEDYEAVQIMILRVPLEFLGKRACLKKNSVWGTTCSQVTQG